MPQLPIEMTEDKELVKVQFYDPEVGYENIWSYPLAGGLYRIENVPFFIYDIALNDIVQTLPSEDDVPEFVAVLERSGNRTLRARSDELIDKPADRLRIEDDLKHMGCTVEEHRERLLAISVPPAVDLAKVTSYLTKVGLSWEYGYPSESNA